MTIELVIDGGDLVVRILGERSGTWGYGVIDEARLSLTELDNAIRALKGVSVARRKK